jgi:bifunctional non-homologous end joining protein LigD
VKDGAREVKKRLEARGLETFIKTTGGKGLHVVVPVAPTPWEAAKDFAHEFALAMEKDDSARSVSVAAKNRRDNRIFVDYLRNARGATAIAPYSTRAQAGATVAVPIAWAELAALRGDRGEDLDRILAATRDPEPARRQVAAALLADADGAIAARAWSRLAADPSRAVRRATLDAVVGAVETAGRQDLRPILEHALADADAWVRWKALRGIVALGLGPSRAAVETLGADPDFRVRLEATRALR